MNIKIINYNMELEFPIEPVMQMCGVNFRAKDFIISSLEKHFSTYRYKDYERKMVDNILYNDNPVGRKYLEICVIRNRQDIIKQLSMTKASLLMKAFQNIQMNYEYQSIYDQLADNLERLYIQINQNILAETFIELGFELHEVLELIQKSIVKGPEECAIEELSSYELLVDLISLTNQSKLHTYSTGKRLYIFSDIDHLLSIKEYKAIIEKCISDRIDSSYYLFTSGTDGYICMNEELITGVSVINDCMFVFEDFDRMREFIASHYPSNSMPDRAELFRLITATVHRIGKQDSALDEREWLIQNILNQALGIISINRGVDNQLEANYLWNSSNK